MCTVHTYMYQAGNADAVLMRERAGDMNTVMPVPYLGQPRASHQVVIYDRIEEV